MTWRDSMAGAHETAIVWDLGDLGRLEDLEYVRVAWCYESSRTRRPRHTHGRVVGWAELDPNCHRPYHGTFERRFFWLAAHDRNFEPEGVYEYGTPCEAVDPLTIAPRVGGHLTARAWYGARRIAELAAEGKAATL